MNRADDVSDRWSLDRAERDPDCGLVIGRRGHVAVVLFDRPDRGNSFHRAMRDRLSRLWLELDADPDVRAIVIGSTTDRVFSTGIDVKEVAGDGEIGRDLTLRNPARGFLTSRMADIWKPVIAAVEGRVNGGGMHFVVDADIVICAETAAFSDTHVNLGFVGALENIGLAARVGLGSALYLTLVGPSVSLDAERAYQLGLAQEVVPAGRAVIRSLELAERIAANSPSAVSRSQEAIWSITRHGIDGALEYGWSLLRRQWDHPDSVEGPRAYAEKRPPQWVGQMNEQTQG